MPLKDVQADCFRIELLTVLSESPTGASPISNWSPCACGMKRGPKGWAAHNFSTTSEFSPPNGLVGAHRATPLPSGPEISRFPKKLHFSRQNGTTGRVLAAGGKNPFGCTRSTEIPRQPEWDKAPTGNAERKPNP